ncbi:YlaH-like family protein [Paenisporosarcina sp. TG20]|uniref:YlaH-like family protein n=1 Tax=Paenisporosarcina sp. TG20 TaxID=1211706 RepID=UPI0003715666|nr:YlaH-like family protein [Paenisporosarcina sp. TG20]
MKEQQFVYDNMYPTARFLYEFLPNYDLAGYALYLVILLLSVFVYKLGFAKKLKMSQNMVIFIFLILGCIVLTFLAIFLPIVEGLIIAAMILILYKIRLYIEKKRSASVS